MKNLCTLFLILTAAAFAQAPQSMPAPSQQQLVMGYFAGDWKLTGTAKISPNGPSSPYTATEHGEWVQGQYFLEIHSVSHGPLGDIHGVRMLEYNPADKAYTYNAYNSLGEHTVAVGKFENENTWTWNAVEKMNGVATNGRYTVILTSNNTYTFKSEVQTSKGAWATVMEGKATRAPPPQQ